jgi:hypothetical protein
LFGNVIAWLKSVGSAVRNLGHSLIRTSLIHVYIGHNRFLLSYLMIIA